MAVPSTALLLAGMTVIAASPVDAATRASSRSAQGASRVVYQVHPIAIKSSVGAPSSVGPGQGTVGTGYWPYTPG